MSARGLARQAGWNYAALLIQLSASLAVTGIAFRALPAADVGTYSLAMATVGLLIVLDPAVGYAITTRIAERSVGTRERFSMVADPVLVQMRTGLTTISAGLLLIVLASTAFASLVTTRNAGQEIIAMVALISTSFCVQLATAAYPAACTAIGDFRGLALAGAAFGAASLAVVGLTISSIGMVSLGAGQLAGQICARSLLRQRLSKTVELPALLAKPQIRSIAIVVSGAGPMFLAGIAGQVLPFADLWLVGSFAGAAAVAAYRAGTIFPTQGASLLYRLYDVIFPRLSHLERGESQERAVTLITRTFSALAGVLFMAVFCLRDYLVEALIGSPNALAADVLAVFCAIWLVNVPVHGLNLLVIARSRQRLLTRVVVCEAIVNVLLSVLLVTLVGPIGPALATLITIAASNLWILPKVLSAEVGAAVTIVGHGIRSGLVGVAASSLTCLPLSWAFHGVFGMLAVGATALPLAVAITLWMAGSEGRRALRQSAEGSQVEA